MNNEVLFIIWIFTPVLILLAIVILAIVINFQNKKFNRKHLELEEKFNEQKLELQRQIIRTNIFPFQKEVYKNLLKIFEFCNSLKNDFEKFDFSNKKNTEIYQNYKLTESLYSFDKNIDLILKNLYDSVYLYPEKITSKIMEVAELFIDIYSKIELLNENDKNQDYYNELNNDIKKNCDIVIGYEDFIKNIIPVELDISMIN